MDNHSINKNHRISAFVFIICLLSFHAHGQSISKNIDSLKQAATNAKTDTGKINALIALADATHYTDIAAKTAYANEALQRSEKIKWEKGIAGACIILGSICEHNKDQNRALKYYLQADSMAKASGDKTNEAFALFSMGNDYMTYARYGKALECFRGVLNLKPALDLYLNSLGDMGIVYQNVGDFPAALTCYDSALKMHESKLRSSNKNEPGDTDEIGLLYVIIGDIYRSIPEYDHAMVNYNKALELSEQTKNKLLTMAAVMGIAATYDDRGLYDQAIASYTRALDNCKDINDKPEEAQIYCELANVYLDKGEPGKALEDAQTSLTLLGGDSSGNAVFKPETYRTMGKIYTRLKEYPKAVHYLEKAIALSKQSGTLDLEKEAWHDLSLAYEKMKKPAQAFDAYRQFITLRDSLFSIGKAREINRIDLQSGYERKQIADSLVQAKKDIAVQLRMQKQRVVTYGGYAGLVVVILLSFFIYRNYSQQKKANVTISKANETIKKEKQVSETLLLNILPEEVATELKTKGVVDAKLFDHVTVLFTDFINFTAAAERFSPQELVAELHTCFKAFDGIISKYNIEKIKTVGDAYLAVSGLPQANPAHASEMIKAAIDIRNFMEARSREMGNKTFTIRIGINSGTVVAGIVGVKKFAYDIWGDTVNIAARMEQYSETGKINISETTYELVKDEFDCTYRGEIETKNKGQMKMYFVS